MAKIHSMLWSRYSDNGRKKDCILLDLAGAIAEHGMPDERRKFIFGKKISRVIDRELGIDENIDDRKTIELSEEKQIYLKK